MTMLKEVIGYILLVAIVAWVLISIGYAWPLDRDDDGRYSGKRPMWQDAIPEPPPRVQSWMDNKGDITYFFNYGSVTMPVPLEQLTHPERGPTFDPFGVIGQGTRDQGWLEMPKRRTK